MSASDHKQLDVQTDAHAHTHACRRVCLVQCWKAASTALSLKAVYCDMLLILALCPIFFTPLFFHWPICAFSAERLSHILALAALVLPQPELELSVASAACF